MMFAMERLVWTLQIAIQDIANTYLKKVKLDCVLLKT